MELQERLIRQMDWDVLIILDAMRWDVWSRVVGEGRPVYSPAGATRGWCEAMKDVVPWDEVVCINANPEVSRTLGDRLMVDVQLWKYGWKVVNGIPTVPPKVVANVAAATKTDWKMVVWFIQPHGPYPLSELPVFKATPEGKADYVLDPQKEIDEGRLTVEQIWDAYRTNTVWVWMEVERLLRRLKGKRVVVTADHGEMLGEKQLWGHWDEGMYDELRMVPWMRG